MSSHLSAPAENIIAITPSDSTDLAAGCRGILCGSGGAAKVTTKAGNAVVIPLQTGYNPIQVTRVWSTSTVASDMWALY